MRTMDDRELLESWAKQRSEPAFAELVQRHLPWVWSAALRQAGDRQLAEDVTQAVFALLARKAGSLRRGTILTGRRWRKKP
jgi:DNA-directed RNA polymerase specialized sigma24 family protein